MAAIVVDRWAVTSPAAAVDGHFTRHLIEYQDCRIDGGKAGWDGDSVASVGVASFSISATPLYC